ncbi:MAG: glycoside hydrolase family 2 TIM barrel-domain containing protein [Bacteroidales bacterium]|nr:glycoside hydrolase family 2 TIM barrel-domain containing protein [Bacteroidales bacterium]
MFVSCQLPQQSIDLSGQWNVIFDDSNFDSLGYDIVLPGTTDGAGLGYADTLTDLLVKPQVLRLTRKHSYVGKARYIRSFYVPENLSGQPLELSLERVLWSSQIKVDGQPVEGREMSLVSPHRHRLPELAAGEHLLEIEVDNSKHLDISVDELCHSYTDATQVKWNGVLGEMQIRPLKPVRIAQVEVYPDVKHQQAKLKIVVENEGNATPEKISIKVSNKELNFIESSTIDAHLGVNEVVLDMKGAALWNEFSPIIYNVDVECGQGADKDVYATTFGMRSLENLDGKLCLNGQPIFLRGTLECCVFPLTGNPPTDEAGWEKVLGKIKEWGLNHLRFHSWCPPDAAFRVADRLGVYLQVELPVWSLKVGDDEDVKQFMCEEMENIIRCYGNHPSLCMISNGNELQYDFDFLNSLTAWAKKRDPRHLYITTSFTFEKGHGGRNEPEDEYYVTQWTDNGWVRGQGVFDAEEPSFCKNYNASMGCLSVPLITHEIGQYAVYPDLKEIDQYTGSLTPHNFMAVRDDLKKKGLLSRAEDYLQASGQLAAILYKEECERAMKTSGLSGYQLLGLQDFPGQGTALVGLLNAFWESKGLVEPAWFRQFCAPVVPLANFEKAVWKSDETLKVVSQIANYSTSDLQDKTLKWKLLHSDGSLCKEGKINVVNAVQGEVTEVGNFEVELSDLTVAEQLTLRLSVDETDYSNSWNIWVYPADYRVENGEVLVTASVKEAEKALREGRKVLLSPNLGTVKGLEGKFLPVFWSPVHFPKQAGTMGLLCNPKHPALALFPTQMFGDWQWWRLEKRATVMNIDSLHEVTPIIEAVDNFANNRQLATVVEVQCGKGKLLLSAIDLLSDGAESPEIKQLLGSLLHYMNSDDFAPTGTISYNELSSLFNA